MDVDSSAKFIGSLTKFLQSLCNGYVEFQRGVELVGHIYLSIDTGEKVDYILHEKVSKNDENSVTFVSNSFHAQPLDKDSNSANKDMPSKSSDQTSKKTSDDDDDDDIMIVDQTKGLPGSTNCGTVPSRSPRQTHQVGGSFNRSHGSSNPMSSPTRNRQQLGPSATVTSQENIDMGEMKLEQISRDELLSLASQVGEGTSSQGTTSSHHGGPPRIGRSSSLGDAAGQPVWIKQETPDDTHGGPDTGWSHGRDGQSDSSNSGSNLYPVMMHQNPAFTSNPVFPGFPSSAASHQHGHAQSLPGTSGAGNPFNPLPGTSQSMSGVDPAVAEETGRISIREGHKRSHAEYMRQYRARMKHLKPEKYLVEKLKDALRARSRRAQIKEMKHLYQPH